MGRDPASILLQKGGRFWYNQTKGRRIPDAGAAARQERMVCLMTGKMGWALAAGLLAAGLLCGFGTAPAYETYTTAGQAASIRIDETVADVTIQTADTDRITVRYAPGEDKDLYSISLEDGCLEVKALDRPRSGPKEGEELRKLVVTLPDQLYQQLDVSIAVGDLTVKGLRTGEMTLAAAVGDVELEDIRADALEAKAAVGRLTVEGLEGKTLTALAGVSNATLKDVRADTVEVNAPLGNVWVEDLQTGDLSVATTVGSLYLKQVTAGSITTRSVTGQLFLEEVSADDWSTITLFGNRVNVRT